MSSLPPLHVLLPELERAVASKTESPALRAMTKPELESTVYSLISCYQAELSDPENFLGRLADGARANGAALGEAKADSLEIRAVAMDRLLEVLRPAAGALVGPIVRDVWHRTGRNDHEEIDPLLRGFELLDGCKKGQVGKGRYERSGESLWIVVLAPVEAGIEHDFDPRYAAIEHTGETAEDHESHAWNLVRLVTVDEAAAMVRDDKFPDLFAGILKRLRSAASGRQDDLAARVREAMKRIEIALHTLEEG